MRLPPLLPLQVVILSLAGFSQHTVFYTTLSPLKPTGHCSVFRPQFQTDRHLCPHTPWVITTSRWLGLRNKRKPPLPPTSKATCHVQAAPELLGGVLQPASHPCPTPVRAFSTRKQALIFFPKKNPNQMPPTPPPQHSRSKPFSIVATQSRPHFSLTLLPATTSFSNS